MEDWKSDWSKHYDDIQWKGVTMFTAAEVLLLAYSYKEFSATQIQIIGPIGLLLNCLIVYYSASFREFRIQLHNSMSESEEKKYLLNTDGKRKLKQWPVYLWFYFFLNVAWLYLFYLNGLDMFLIMCIVIPLAAYWLWIWKSGDIGPNI